MPHIGKNRIDDKLYQKLFSDMVSVLSGDGRESVAIVSALLTDTEQTMLTKRFAAVMLLEAGYSSYKIGEILKVSTSTAKRWKVAFEADEYKDITIVFKRSRENKKQREEMVRMFNKVMRLGMPSMGADRWDDVFGK